MKYNTRLGLIVLLFPFLVTVKAQRLPRLAVAESNHHFLQTSNGKPFFWLGDTVWLLFSKLNREESIRYLQDRANKGFNVIQVMVLHELNVTNYYGDSALIHQSIITPNSTKGNNPDDPDAYDYWDHLDYVIREAGKKGIYIALVPIWGDIVKSGNISAQQAVEYTTWLVRRYRSKSNIIWINGGDIRGDAHAEIWQAMGETIRKNDSRHLITFHPFGRTSSSWWYHEADWLDLNEFQSGHQSYEQDRSDKSYGEDNWKYIRDDYVRMPVKPTLDGEPSYEGIPHGLHDGNQPYWNADDVRRYAYWSVFSGGCGFTYGHNAIMQMHKPGDTHPAFSVREYWDEALQAPGAMQMKHLKELMLSQSYFDRIPDQSILVEPERPKYAYQAATRGKNFAFVYTYDGSSVAVILGKLAGNQVLAKWFNPRNGEITTIGQYENAGTRVFEPAGPPGDGKDWVLILESVK